MPEYCLHNSDDPILKFYSSTAPAPIQFWSLKGRDQINVKTFLSLFFFLLSRSLLISQNTGEGDGWLISAREPYKWKESKNNKASISGSCFRFFLHEQLRPRASNGLYFRIKSAPLRNKLYLCFWIIISNWLSRDQLVTWRQTQAI